MFNDESRSIEMEKCVSNRMILFWNFYEISTMYFKIDRLGKIFLFYYYYYYFVLFEF